MLTKALAERRRNPAATVDAHRPGKRRGHRKAREPSVDSSAGAWPAYLPVADADMVFAPDLITGSLDAGGMELPLAPAAQSPLFAAPVEVKSLYQQLDARLDRANDGAPIEDAGTRIEPAAEEAPAQNGEERAEPADDGKDAKKDDKKDDKKEEKKAGARDGEGEGRDGKGAKPGADKKKGPPKGTRKSAKLAPQAEAAPAPPGPAPLPEIPATETGPTQLPGEPSLRADSPPAFASPNPPNFRPARPAGGKPEAPGRDAQLALAAFREAVAAARRFHEILANDAAEAVGRVQAGADRLANLRQRDLDHGLDSLARALDEARMGLDRSADAADQLINRRERATRGRIRAIAQAGLTALGGAWSTADKTLKAHSDNKDLTKAAGRGKISEVTRASTAASRKINDMVPTREELFPDDANALEVAKNEKIKRHLASATKPSAEIYDKEAAAEIKSMTATFDQMDTQLDKQFTDIRTNMASTATSSGESMTKVRDSALRQASDKADELHSSVAQARAGGHAALVKQHNISRRQLIANHRDRGRGEAQAARQRALRGGNALTALATAQQTGTRALATTLAKESERPAAEFARVMKSSATSFAKQVERTRADQRPKLIRGAEGAEPPAMAQGQASSARSAKTADDMGQRILESGESASTALTEQIEKGVEPFGSMAEPVAETRSSTLTSARTSYAAANQKAGEAVVLANGTVTSAWEGKGGGNTSDTKDAPPATPKPGEGPGAAEAPSKFVPRADQTSEDPQKNDQGVASFLSKVRIEIEKMITGKVGTIHGYLTASSTPVESVLAELRAITAKQGAALSYQYRKVYKRSLRKHLDSELRKVMSTGDTDDANVRAAMNYLNGNHIEGARQEMKAAVNWSNDEGRVERVQRMLTPAELGQLNDTYKTEMEEIVSDLGGNEEKAARALNEIKGAQKGETKEQRETREEKNIQQLGIANAYGLQHDIDQAREKRGEAGGDKTAEAVEKKYQSIGTDVLSGFNPMDAGFEDPEVVAERKKKLWKATGEQFENVVKTLPDGTPYKAPPGEKGGLGAIARYASAARTYTEYVPNEYGEGGHTKRVSEGLDRHQSELIDAIAKSGPDSEDAAAATIMAELNRKSGPPREDKMRKALGSDMLAAVEGESTEKREAAKKDVVVNGKVIKGTETLARERRDKILRRVGELDASAKAAAQPTGDGAKGAPPQPKPPEEVKQQLLNTLDSKFANDPTAKAYTRSMLEHHEPDPVAAFEFAIAHEGKNKETLTAATSRMDRDEIDKAVAAWDKKNPDGPSLYEKLGLFEQGKGKGILEGDARNEVELKFMGVPRNDRERAEVANMTTKQQVRDAGIAGPGLAAEEYQRMLSNQNKLLKAMGVTKNDIDEKGRIRLTDKNGNKITGNFDESGRLKVKDERDREGFESMMQLSTFHADNYKQTVDKIAAGITMALMVVAAVVTTFLTAGGAAAIWGPILITAGAGLVGIAMTAAIRGDRYTTAELQRDLVMTFVQAATAGLGAYAGTALKGAGNAAKAAASAPKVVGAVQKPALSLGAKAVNFGKEVLIDSAIGGTTNAINSGAGAAMDPENRRQGKSAEKALEGGFKGFISGAAGAALTKPMGDAAKKLKGGALGERVASNVAGGFTTRLTEARVGQAMGDPHQSWAESLEVAKEGVIQDVVQAAGEHGAHGAGERRAARKMAARLAGAGETPAQPAARPAAAEPLAARPPADPAAPRPAVDAPALAPRTSAPDQPPARPRAPRPAPPEPPGPQHTPESMARAAAVHEALPPEARGAVDAALPVKPPAPDPAQAPDALPLRPADLPAAPRPAAPEAPGRRAEDGDGAPPARHADEDGAAAKGRPAAEEDPAARPRAAAHPDDEPMLRTASDVDDNDGIGSVAPGDPPRFPDGVDLKPGMLDGMDPLKAGEKIVATDPKDQAQAKQNYEMLRARSPDREALLAYNPKTGEYMVYQGMRSTVKPPPAGWITVRHSHPSLTHANPDVIFARILPSGFTGDFTVLRSELNRMPGAEIGLEVRHASVIDIEVNGHPVQTTFEITRKGDHYSLSVTINPPMHGQSKLGPFQGSYEVAFREYAYKGRALTGENCDFGLSKMREAPPDHFRSADADPAGRVVRGATPTESERHDALLVADRVQTSIEADPKLPPSGKRSEEDLHHALNRAQTPDDAKQVVAKMGLVGEPDSMKRLSNILNDGSIDVDARARLAKAVLDATRDEMVRANKLEPDDELLMIFHGAPDDQIASYKEKGIDMGMKPGGANDDLGMGLYMSQDLRSAMGYHGESGQVIPWIATRKQLGHVIDIRPGSPLRAAWEKFFVSYAGQKGVTGDARVWTRPTPKIEPMFGVFGIGKAMRGAVFGEFLARIAKDPSIPKHIQDAAKDPHIILSDLGGPATYGNDRKFVTDQAAVRAQHVANMINEQMGFPKVGAGHSDSEPMLRSADHNAPQADLGSTPVKPKPPIPEPETLPHFDRALERALKPSLQELDGLVRRTAKAQSLVSEADLAAYVREPDQKIRGQMRDQIEAQMRAGKASGADIREARRSLAEFEFKLREYLNVSVGESMARLPELTTAVVASYVLEPNPANRELARKAIAQHLAAKGESPERIGRILSELSSLESRVGNRTRQIAGHLHDGTIVDAAGAAVPANMQRAVDHSPALAVLAARDPKLFAEIAKKYFDKFPVAHAGADAEQFFIDKIRDQSKLKSKKNAGRAADAAALLGMMEPLRPGVGDYDSGLEAAASQVRGSHDIGHSRAENRPDQNFEGRVPLIAEDGVKPGMRVDHYEHGRATVMEVNGDTIKLKTQSGAEVEVKLSQLDTFPAANTSGELVPEFVPLRDDKAQKAAQDDIDRIRKEESLPAYEHDSDAGTVSIARALGQEGIGTNSTMSARTVNLTVRERAEMLGLFKALGIDYQGTMNDPRFTHHAELASLVTLRSQLRKAGQPMPEVVELFVDRKTCDSCKKNLSAVAAYLGIPELRIYVRGEKPVIIRAR